MIERCIDHGVLIIGIEVFTSKAELLEVRIREEGEETNDWCFDLLSRYQRWKGVFFDATYQVPPDAIGQ